MCCSLCKRNVLSPVRTTPCGSVSLGLMFSYLCVRNIFSPIRTTPCGSVSLGLMHCYLCIRNVLSLIMSFLLSGLHLVVFFTWLDGLLFVYEECPFSYEDYTL